MKQITLLLAALALLAFASCERCTSDEPTIFLNLIDSTGEELTRVDEIYALNQINDKFNGEFALVLDFSRDSTVYIIQRDNQTDTLTFRYERILSTGTGGSGYCMKIQHQKPKSSLDIECYRFDTSFNLGIGFGPNSNHCPAYEITLSY